MTKPEPQGDDNGGLWLWKEGKDWIWTTKDLYRYLYHHESSEWVYFLKTTGGRIYYFRSETNAVESVAK